MDWFDKISNAAGSVLESVGEGASSWVDKFVQDEVAEIGAQPETNEQRGQNVTFGDGKEKPTVQATVPAQAQLISGVDNKMLLLGGLGIAALLLIKG
jgi:hypothetical protein